MTIVLAKNWWSLVIRGLVGIMLGLITLAWPRITFDALVLLFGAYALIDGSLGIAGAWQAAGSGERWGALLLEGLAGIAAAAITIIWPAITALALVYIIGAWAIVTGVFEIAAAVRLRQHIAHEWLLGLSGFASILFGVLVMAVPLAGALAIALWVGAYAFISGILLVALGLRLRTWTKTFSAGRLFPEPIR